MAGSPQLCQVVANDLLEGDVGQVLADIEQAKIEY